MSAFNYKAGAINTWTLFCIVQKTQFSKSFHLKCIKPIYSSDGGVYVQLLRTVKFGLKLGRQRFNPKCSLRPWKSLLISAGISLACWKAIPCNKAGCPLVVRCLQWELLLTQSLLKFYSYFMCLMWFISVLPSDSQRTLKPLQYWTMCSIHGFALCSWILLNTCIWPNSTQYFSSMYFRIKHML